MGSNANYPVHRQFSFTSVVTMLIFFPYPRDGKSYFFPRELNGILPSGQEINWKNYKETELSVPTFKRGPYFYEVLNALKWMRVYLVAHVWLFYACFQGFLYITNFIHSPILYCGFPQESKGAEETLLRLKKMTENLNIGKMSNWDIIFPFHRGSGKKVGFELYI